MLKDVGYLRRREKEWAAAERLTYDQAVAIIEGLREEALALGVWPPDDPLEGIEVDIRVARIINACSKNSSPA